jgi:hypothetical protein
MKKIYCHSCHRHLFPPDGAKGIDAMPFIGIEIRFSEVMPKWVKKWVFPKERFWEYEPSDEKWCRQLGIGHEEETSEPLILIVDEPSILELCRQPLIPAYAITA